MIRLDLKYFDYNYVEIFFSIIEMQFELLSYIVTVKLAVAGPEFDRALSTTVYE